MPIEKRSTQGGGQFLYSLASRAPLDTLKIVGSVARGNRRDVLGDAGVLLKANNVEVSGSENLPSSITPILFVGNHPPIADTFLGSAAVTVEFAKKRSHLPHEYRGIKWMVARELEVAAMPEGKTDAFIMGVRLALANNVLRKLHNSYEFIQVPINYAQSSSVKESDRSQALRIARNHLVTSGGSQAVGIFPEGNFGEELSLNTFHEGIGTLVKVVNNLTVIPFGLYRNDGRALHVEFGKPLSFVNARKMDRGAITSEVQDSVRALSQKA